MTSPVLIITNSSTPGPDGDTRGRNVVANVLVNDAQGNLSVKKSVDIVLPTTINYGTYSVFGLSFHAPAACFDSHSVAFSGSPQLLISTGNASTNYAPVMYNVSGKLKVTAADYVSTGATGNGLTDIIIAPDIPSISFKGNAYRPQSFIGQRFGPNPQHPNYGNWEIMTIREVTSPHELYAGNTSLAAVNTIPGMYYAAYTDNDHHLFVDSIDSAGYAAAQKSINVFWNRHSIDKSLSSTSIPAISWNAADAKRLHIFYIKDKLSHFTLELNADGTITSNETVIPVKDHKLISDQEANKTLRPRAVWHNSALYCFYGTTENKISYVKSADLGNTWSSHTELDITMPTNEPSGQPAKHFVGFGVTGVADGFLDASFLE